MPKPKTPAHPPGSLRRAATWVRDRAGDGAEALVLAALGGITFATSADHVLEVGRVNGVTGWHAWSVAGTVEIIAAYTGLEIKRRKGARRLLPLAVFAGSAGFLFAANLASAAGATTWGKAYSVVPPIAFLAVMLIAETKRWPARPKPVLVAASRLAPKHAPDGAPVPAAGAAAGPAPGHASDGAPEGAPATAPETAPAAASDGAPDVSVRARILGELAKGDRSPAQLVAAGCGTPATVKSELGRMVRRGDIVSPARGIWRVKKRKLAAVN